MKKVFSLLLILALMTSMVFALGIPDINDGTRRLDDADIPADVMECDPSVAGVRLDLADGRTMYFEELDNMNYIWGTFQNCDRTFTLLKDHVIYIPLKAQEEWRNVPMTTVDLNGYNIISMCENFLFDNRFDAHLTVKNGTIYHNGNKSIGRTGSWEHAVLADRYGYPITQEMHFENMTIIADNPECQIFMDWQWKSTISFKDSVIWCTGAGFVGQKSDASSHSQYKFQPWPKDATFDGNITIENCIIGCASGATIATDGTHTVNVKNSTLVSSDGKVFDSPGTFNAEGEGKQSDFSATFAGKSLTGVAMTYGTPTVTIPEIADFAAAQDAALNSVVPETPAEPETPSQPETPAQPEDPTETPETPTETPETTAEESGSSMGLIIGIVAAVAVAAVVVVVVLKKKKQ